MDVRRAARSVLADGDEPGRRLRSCSRSTICTGATARRSASAYLTAARRPSGPVVGGLRPAEPGADEALLAELTSDPAALVLTPGLLAPTPPRRSFASDSARSRTRLRGRATLDAGQSAPAQRAPEGAPGGARAAGRVARRPRRRARPSSRVARGASPGAAPARCGAGGSLGRRLGTAPNSRRRRARRARRRRRRGGGRGSFVRRSCVPSRRSGSSTRSCRPPSTATSPRASSS